MCDGKGKGMEKAGWFILHSDLDKFHVCGACFASIVEPFGIAQYFKAKTMSKRRYDRWCIGSFNPVAVGFQACLYKMVEMMYKQGPSPLDEFVRARWFELCS